MATLRALMPRRSMMRSFRQRIGVSGLLRWIASTHPQRSSGEPCLVIGPRRTLESDARWRGVSPAQEHSCPGPVNLVTSPISATRTAAMDLDDVPVRTRQHPHGQLGRPVRHQPHPDRRSRRQPVLLHLRLTRVRFRPGNRDRLVAGQDLGHRLPRDLQPGQHVLPLSETPGQLVERVAQFGDLLPPIELLQPRHHRRLQDRVPGHDDPPPDHERQRRTASPAHCRRAAPKSNR